MFQSLTNKFMGKIIAIVFGLLLAAGLPAFLLSLLVWLLWNWLMPELFGLKTITWLQALGLSVLSGCLFRSSLFRSSCSSSSKE